jgi:hypothetical protein
LNHDYTEADEEDEFKVSLFHLLHLLGIPKKSDIVLRRKISNPTSAVLGFSP